MDLTAPGFDPEAVGLSWWKRAFRQGLGYFAPSVFFLLIPLFYAYGQVSWDIYVGLCARMFLVALLYVGSTLACELPFGGRCAWVGALLASIVTLTLPYGSGATLAQIGYYAVMFTCAAAILLPRPISGVLTVIAGVATVAAGVAEEDYLAAVMGVMAGILGWSIAAGVQNGHNRRLLHREQQRTAALAVAAERERIGRDLHDILGHSLTAIAVKAELAGRLLERDQMAARVEIDDVLAITRQALADVRATASGMRDVRLATEVAAARSILAAANVECVVPAALPVLDEVQSELFGYVVREGVTNVVRHAGASRCVIAADELGVSITDDGRGIPRGQRQTGLAGLRERVTAAGGSLTVDSRPGCTVLTATLREGS